MTPQELKNSILQLAIQGKLVEQRQEEGTAEELYKQIQTEKQALVKAGKIKKEKPLPEITEDEIPFEIPESWMWVRVANIWAILNGDRGKNYPAKSTLSHCGIPFISALNLDGKTVINDDNLLCLSEAQYDRLGNGKLQQGDVVVCIRGSLGKHGRFPFEKGAIASSLVIMRSQLVLPILDDFLMLYRDAPLFCSEIKKYNNGTAQPNLAAKSFEQFLFPLPPLAEQKRIVAKIEELLPLIERYEKAWSRLEDFNKRFPGDMQKSILQMAIQGKLVEQRPMEGTGEELYRQIQAEKQTLIKAGKIKKEKPLLEIAEDEIPFEIPESWKWVRIGKVFNLQAGKSVTSADIYEDYSPEHQYRCFGGNGCRGYVAEYNRSGHYALIGRQGALCGNINYADGLFYATEHAVVVEQFAGTDVLWCGYFLKALNLNQYATATAQPGLAVANINQVLIPLPPLAEQKRIVARLEELLPLCERLK